MNHWRRCLGHGRLALCTMFMCTLACRADTNGAFAEKPTPPVQAAGQGTQGTQGTVTAQISGFKSNQGQALVAVFCSPEGFPDNPHRACAKQAAKIEKQAVEITFPNIPAGDFAVAAHHDENGDFKMNTGLFGIPKEGYGASRDARGTFGPPKFKDAKLLMKAGTTAIVAMKMTY